MLEIYKIVSGVNIAIIIKTTLKIIIDWFKLPIISIIIYTDLYSLYKYLVKLNIIKYTCNTPLPVSTNSASRDWVWDRNLPQSMAICRFCYILPSSARPWNSARTTTWITIFLTPFWPNLQLIYIEYLY